MTRSELPADLRPPITEEHEANMKRLAEATRRFRAHNDALAQRLGVLELQRRA